MKVPHHDVHGRCSMSPHGRSNPQSSLRRGGVRRARGQRGGACTRSPTSSPAHVEQKQGREMIQQERVGRVGFFLEHLHDSLEGE
jgi:hypothetical protein